MIFVSNRTSRHWDVLFDRTTVDMSIDGRNLARGVPWGAREAMGPVRRAIPGRRVASARCALFCNEIYDIVTKFFTCVSNRTMYSGTCIQSPSELGECMGRCGNCELAFLFPRRSELSVSLQFYSFRRPPPRGAQNPAMMAKHTRGNVYCVLYNVHVVRTQLESNYSLAGG